MPDANHSCARERYLALTARANETPEDFWAEQAQRIARRRPFWPGMSNSMHAGSSMAR